MRRCRARTEGREGEKFGSARGGPDGIAVDLVFSAGGRVQE